MTLSPINQEYPMRIVVALGGNALLRHGEEMSSENQRENVSTACEQLAPVAAEHELVISHGNGPQVGLLALQCAAYAEVPAYPLDVLGAETQGMIGYMVEQELGNRLPFDKPLATILTMIEVDPDDPAFDRPTKPIGPCYGAKAAELLAEERSWAMHPDGEGAFRRVVASPKPKRIFECRQIMWLLDHGAVVICAGGGGIPTMYVDSGPRPLSTGASSRFAARAAQPLTEDRRLVGVEAVIDKDLASGLLARDIGADVFVMATDADAVYLDYGTPGRRAIARAHPDALTELATEFPEGPMLPKVVAACDFARSAAGKVAAIGALRDIEAMVAGKAGTIVTTHADGIELRPA